VKIDTDIGKHTQGGAIGRVREQDIIKRFFWATLTRGRAESVGGKSKDPGVDDRSIAFSLNT
jgi:hypothetical protein